METAAVLQEQQRQEHHGAGQDTTHPHTDTNTHALDDTEDYGPLKKKHKYRDERDKERSGSTSYTYGTAPSAAAEAGGGDTTLTLDSSLEMEGTVPGLPAVAAAAPAGAASAERDQDHVAAAPSQTEEAPAREQEQQHQQHQQHNDAERSESRDLAGSPGSVTEKTRKHNFYVPSRELAALFDNAASTASALTGGAVLASNGAHSLSPVGTLGSNGGGIGNSNLSDAQANANALLGMGTSITGRQAAKIAAMEAKEKARLAKEAELEESKARKKAELERKRLENARKKAEKEALQSAAGAGPTSPSISPAGMLQRRKGSMSNQGAAGQTDSTIPPPIGGSTKAGPTRSRRGATSRRSNAKAKHESPELPIPNDNLTNTPSLASFDVQVQSPSSTSGAIPPTSNFNIPVTAGPSHSAAPLSSPVTAGGITLPPMPAPATEGMMGFIPYASEGARAAALAKAAKQKLNHSSNNGSASSIPVGLPTPAPVKNGKATGAQGGGGGGRKGTSNSTGSHGSTQQTSGATFSSQAGASNQQQGNKRSRTSNNSGSSSNNARTKALHNIATQNSIASSGRASPTNALEHAAAAIDAVLDAGALARAQAQAEEEEVDDRLYCICQQLYNPERLMIACDRCDNWFHSDCVNIDEPAITLIDLFICPICEKDHNLQTVAKARCSRKECNAPALKLSKYCSDLCGFKAAASRLEASSSVNQLTTSNPEDLNLLWDAVFEVKKLETVVKSVDGEEETEGGKEAGDRVEAKIEAQAALQSGEVNGEKTEDNAMDGYIPKGADLGSRIAEEEYRLDQLQISLSDYVTKRENLEVSLSLINARLSYLQLAVRRWEAACQAHAANAKPTTSNKKLGKSKSGGGAVNADAPCGFDVRLVWDDKDWQEWLDSEEGRTTMMVAEEEGDDAALPTLSLRDEGENGHEDGSDEEGLVCKLSRRKCDRHSAWQKLRDADYRVEKAANEKQLEQLTERERGIRRRVEDIQDFLRRAREKLIAETAKKNARQEEEEEGKDRVHQTGMEDRKEDEEVVESDSMPPTPAVVLTEP